MKLFYTKKIKISWHSFKQLLAWKTQFSEHNNSNNIPEKGQTNI